MALYKNEKKNESSHSLFPNIQPYSNSFIYTKDGYQIYFEECGNPNGLPVFILHGGPGAGCNPNMRKYFDPKFYRIILFDQRGCGRSQPHASVENNTTWHLIDDIENIRKKLNLNKILIFGGSWGSTLGLIYSINFPQNVIGMILRGIFMMTKSELDWFYKEGGASLFWPEKWHEFVKMIPQDERNNIIKAYHKRLFNNSKDLQEKFSIAWFKWETALASMQNSSNNYTPSIKYALAFSRIENHYFINKGFLKEENYILKNVVKLKDIPGIIIQGRYDMVCPPNSAYRLHDAWSKSELKIMDFSGHAMSEPKISEELIEATEKFKKL